MVKTPEANVPVTPLGNPETVAPVALPPIVYLMIEIGAFSQTDWFEVFTAVVSVRLEAGMIVTAFVKTIGTIQVALVKTETVVNVVVVVTEVTVTDRIPDGLKVMVRFAPLLILYVT
jgi:hypothetical protein